MTVLNKKEPVGVAWEVVVRSKDNNFESSVLYTDPNGEIVFDFEKEGSYDFYVQDIFCGTIENLTDGDTVEIEYTVDDEDEEEDDSPEDGEDEDPESTNADHLQI